jgi:hypothetical protein
MIKLEEWPWHNVEPEPNQHELYSIAISLKRIADKIAPRDPREVKPNRRIDA